MSVDVKDIEVAEAKASEIKEEAWSLEDKLKKIEANGSIFSPNDTIWEIISEINGFIDKKSWDIKLFNKIYTKYWDWNNKLCRLKDELVWLLEKLSSELYSKTFDDGRFNIVASEINKMNMRKLINRIADIWDGFKIALRRVNEPKNT